MMGRARVREQTVVVAIVHPHRRPGRVATVSERRPPAAWQRRGIADA